MRTLTAQNLALYLGCECSDLHNYRFNQHEVTTFLLSKHFDLFGWIAEGLALDKNQRA